VKFVFLGYYDEKKFAQLSEAERKEMIAPCFAYDDELRRGGHFLHGAALQFSSSAVTLHGQGGKVIVTDGPYAETKEQIGGIGFIEARDLNHAIQLISKHPAVHWSKFEIRPEHEMDLPIEA
jgi:hypothetical protein